MLPVLGCRDVLRLEAVLLQVVNGHVSVGQAGGQHVRVVWVDVDSCHPGAGTNLIYSNYLRARCYFIRILVYQT